MPNYSFKNKKTGEEFEERMSWDEKVKYLEENPHITSVITAPQIISGTGNFNSKVPQWHKDNMKEMKKLHPKGNYGSID
jgi:hypothetical protein